MSTGTSTAVVALLRPVPNICMPPWAGGGYPPVVRHQADHGQPLFTRESEAPRRVDKPAHDLHDRAVPDRSQQSQVSANASMKSFPANTTTNWNVNVVLDRVLLELWQRHDVRHIHQLVPQAAAPRGRAPARSRPPCAACPSPAAAAPARSPAAPHPRACHRQRKVRSTRQDPRWLSSVPVGLRASRAPHHSCGEGLQPAPSRRSDVRAVASNAAVAVFAAIRLRVQPAAARKSQPLMVTLKKETQTCLSLVVVVVRRNLRVCVRPHHHSHAS